MIESPLEQITADAAEAAGWLVRKMQWLGRRNAPDRFYAKNGRIVLIEHKKPGADARPGQEKEIQALRDAGVEVYVCDTHIAALRVLGVPYAPFK